MRKLFPREYWLSWLGAAVVFAALFPLSMFSDPEISVHYAVFAVALSAISTVLLRTILFRVWVKRFYSDSYRVYAWFLAVQAFCHLVFTGMNPRSWVYIGASVAVLLGMLLQVLKERKNKT